MDTDVKSGLFAMMLCGIVIGFMIGATIERYFGPHTGVKPIETSPVKGDPKAWCPKAIDAIVLERSIFNHSDTGGGVLACFYEPRKVK